MAREKRGGQKPRKKEANQHQQENKQIAQRLARALDGYSGGAKGDSKGGAKASAAKSGGKRNAQAGRPDRDGGKKAASSDGRRFGKAANKTSKGTKAAKAAKSDKQLAKPKKEPSAKQPVEEFDSPCKVDALCGGCMNVAVPYKQQLADKDFQVRGLLYEAGLLGKGVDVRVIKGMDDPFHYRNKVVSPFARGRKVKQATGKDKAKDKGRRNKLDCEILTGMYQAGTHQLVSTDGCLIENKQANKVVKVVKNLMIHHGIAPYDEDSGTGFMRHVVVRVGHQSGEVLVTLVTNQRDFPSSKSFCRELISRCPFVTTVVQNVNTRQTNVILGVEEHVLYGPGFILDTLCGLSFRISSQSFYQVNATQTEVLYNTAIQLAQLTGAETVIDAYCGTGTIGLVAAKNGAAQVIGVDSVFSSISDACNNAKHNSIENAQFVVKDAGDAMRDWAAEGRLDPAQTVLMMDPPRAGSDEAFLAATCQLAPSRIVYISCNPATQVRDMQYLVKHGYCLQVVQPVDMFPHTDHVESVALLTRKAGETEEAR